ncbi:crocetin glucosyltransferase 2 [Canna indica]|uniref:Crocetin glucosyltransferase 2 n=1 Tax=Canna indica TaxID=4628 RepID=A0AAQ3Q4Q8_9LILI|nr:crocetin glucosyltransferase 2 [Canna indica]
MAGSARTQKEGRDTATSIPCHSWGIERFAARGLVFTLATTCFILRTTRPEPGTVRLVAISDGFGQAGYTEAGSVPAHLDHLE